MHGNHEPKVHSTREVVLEHNERQWVQGEQLSAWIRPTFIRAIHDGQTVVPGQK